MGKFAIFLLALIASAAAGISFYLKVEQQRSDLKEKIASLGDIKAEHERRELRIIPKKEENLDLQAQVDRVTRLTEESQSLTSQIQTLEKSLADLKREFIQIVMQVRQGSIGMAWPDIKTSDGRILTGVKIQRISETDITLSNSLGTFRLPAGNLPPDMRDRFRIDASPMTGSAELLASIPPTPQTGEATSVAPIAAAPLAGAMLAKVGEIQANLRTQEAKQAELQRIKQAYFVQFQDYNNKDSIAKFMGKPQKYQTIIPRIAQAIHELDKQLAEVSAKIVTLQIQADDIREGKIKGPVGAPGSPH